MWECSHIMAKSVKNEIKNYKIGMSTTIKDKLKKIITETVFDINAVVFYSTLGIAILMTIASVVIAKCRIVMFYVDQTQMSALFTTTAQIVGGLYGLTLTASSRCWACENSFYI